MPELPEVETVRGVLCQRIGGHLITGVRAGGVERMRPFQAAREVESSLAGRRICGISRRGKYLTFELDDQSVLVVHLGMSGRLLLREVGAKQPPHCHLQLELAEAGLTVLLVDPRRFGQVMAAPRPELLAGFSRLGPDAWPEPPDFGERLARRRVPVKVALMNQSVVAGLGNIYSDEILHRAGVLGDRLAAEVTPQEALNLQCATREVLTEAIALAGSTLVDGGFVDPDGRPGRFQHRHRVYGRYEKPCLSCDGVIGRLRLQGRTTYYCRGCQH